MNRNERVAKQLGMSVGAASHRLRKQLLFKYVKQAGDHFCYRCGLEIETVEELSIEHILPWENRDIERFWNLDNIAFSHLKCNRPHNPVSERTKIRAPEGLVHCYDCGGNYEPHFFAKDSRQWHGLNRYCRSCSTRQKRAWRETKGRN